MDSAGFLAAIERGNMRKIREFVSKEPIEWKTVVNKDGIHAVALAIFYKYLEMVEYFLSIGWNIESRVDKSGSTGFLYAAYFGFVGGVDLFVERGCNIEAKNDHGNGALALACFEGHFAMVKKLIGMGFSVNETHQYDSISLHFAADQGHVDIAAYLIEKGADIEAETRVL
ncbi:uncharacterized protein [Oscarella lobularis]|uniref:uncharacterized protein n=1 Tax=Oscarella lobularis TaxID=121494 RepID=UPI0033138D93